MRVTIAHVKGSKLWNEDAVVANSPLGIYGVVDGATSIGTPPGWEGMTGGYLAAQLIAETFNSMIVPSGASVGLPEQMLLANQRLHAEMIQQGVDVTRSENLWGACAVVVRLTATHVEFAQVGDTLLVTLHKNGTAKLVTPDQVAAVSNRTLQEYAEGMASGLRTQAELWAYVKPQMIKNRQLANKPQGYGVINGNIELRGFIASGKFSLDGVQALFLMSDGLYVPRRHGDKPCEATDILLRVKEVGLPAYIEWLSVLEESDPECRRYPRLKRSDDKTAVLIELETTV